MLKLVILGEAHNSFLAPQLAADFLEICSSAGKEFIVLVEDPSLLEFDKIDDDFVDRFHRIYEAKKHIKENSPDLFDKMMSGDDFDISADELKILRDVAQRFFGKEKITADLVVGFINGFEDVYGSSERFELYNKFRELLPRDSLFHIDKSLSANRIKELQTLLSESEGNDVEKYEQELSELLSSQDVEIERVREMSDQIISRCKDLPRDALILIYPVGAFHVPLLKDKVEEFAKIDGVDLQIQASIVWDSNQQRRESVEAAIGDADLERADLLVVFGDEPDSILSHNNFVGALIGVEGYSARAASSSNLSGAFSKLQIQ